MDMSYPTVYNTKTMTVFLQSRLGRPRYVAELDDSKDPAIQFRERFYAACSTLRYRDIMALSRALNCSTRAIESWKYKEKMTDIGTALTVIEWIKQGKPMRLERPAASKFSMF